MATDQNKPKIGSFETEQTNIEKSWDDYRKQGTLQALHASVHGFWNKVQSITAGPFGQPLKNVSKFDQEQMIAHIIKRLETIHMPKSSPTISSWGLSSACAGEIETNPNYTHAEVCLSSLLKKL